MRTSPTPLDPAARDGSRRRARRSACAVALVVLVSLASAVAARTDDRRLLDVVRDGVPRVRAAAAVAAGGRGGADAVQRHYDVSRAFEEALRGGAPVSPGCARLLAAAFAFARGNVTSAEGVDRLSAGAVRAGAARAASALRRLRRERTRCRPAPATPRSPVPGLLAPPPNGVVFGPLVVRARIPAGATSADVHVDGRRVLRVPVAGRSLAVRLATRPGRHTVAARFYADGRLRGSARSWDVWQLSAASAQAVAPRERDRSAERRLEDLRRRHGGYSAVWVHDLRSGRTVASNADALFPAASTVKLGVLLAALSRYPAPLERSPVGYDLAALTRWSSNLASNRLLLAIAGSHEAGAAVAQRARRRAGATRSTFTGGYRVGTARGAATGALGQPPLVSGRVTTARDLGRVLFRLHAGALGRSRSLRALGLDARRAGVALGLLLSSSSAGDNVGLLRPTLGSSVPIAQKHGWISTARHTAAIVYGPNGPTVVVVLTYDGRGVFLARASALARGVLRALKMR